MVFAAVLFPGNPLTVLRDALADVLAVVHEVLVHTADVIGGRPAAAGWPLRDVDRVHQQLGALIQARISARQTLVAPRWWGVRERALGAEQQTTQVAVLAGSALHLARVVTTADDAGGRLPEPVHAAIGARAAGAAMADADPAAAAAHAAAARHCASALDSAARNRTDLVLAAAVQTCVDDLQQVIDLRQ